MLDPGAASGLDEVECADCAHLGIGVVKIHGQVLGRLFDLEEQQVPITPCDCSQRVAHDGWLLGLNGLGTELHGVGLLVLTARSFDRTVLTIDLEGQ